MFSFSLFPSNFKVTNGDVGRNNVQAVTTQQQQLAFQQRKFHSQTYRQSQVYSKPSPQQDSCAPLQLGKSNL